MPAVSPQTKQTLALELGKHELIKFGSFTLKSGIVSPIYIDLRQAQSFPSTLRAVTATYEEMLADVDAETFLAGVPEAGTPLATATGYETGRRLLQPRKVFKEHGTKSSVEGAYQSGDSVVLIDDLITKGDSKLEAIRQLETAGLVIDRFLVLIDREQGGIDAIQKAGYTIEAAMTISELLDILRDNGMIDEPKHAEVMEFIRSN